MYWIDNNTGIETPPAQPPVISAVKRFFTNGGLGVPPSIPEDFWFHMIQEELLSILNEAGIQPVKSDLAQLPAAIKELARLVASADGVYKKNNILGSVGQSSGVPTGAIMERGSNANGDYLKFADGTMICMLRADLNCNIVVPNAWGSTSGSGFIPSDDVWTFPAQFAPGTLPLGFGNPEGRYGHGGASAHLSQITASSAIKRMWLNVSDIVVCNFFVIGKWF